MNAESTNAESTNAESTLKKVHFADDAASAAEGEEEMPFERFPSTPQIQSCPFMQDKDVDEEEVASLVEVISAGEEEDANLAGEMIRSMHRDIVGQQKKIEEQTATIEDSILQTATLSQSLQAKKTALKKLVPPLNVLIKQIETQQGKGSLTLAEAAQVFQAITTCRAVLQAALQE